jgi:hypothetical protein
MFFAAGGSALSTRWSVMLSQKLTYRLGVAFCICGICAAQNPETETHLTYHLEAPRLSHYRADQIELLERLNRADRGHLGRLRQVIVPNRWDLGTLAYSPMPRSLERFSNESTAILVDLASQVFGAYEFGKLVRWGPVSTGARGRETPPGLYHLNWNARVRISSLDPTWIMPWYFNISASTGIGMHQYTLPGRPASHGCVRMLGEDARWLFHWGRGWRLDSDRRQIEPGTPVVIVGHYNYSSSQPWLKPTWWTHGVDLSGERIASVR